MQLKNSKRFLRDLNDRKKKVKHAQRIGVAAGSLIIVNAASSNAPYRTGTLKRSIRVKPDGLAAVKGDKVYADVGSPEPYAATHEYGIDPYQINSPVKLDVGWRYIGTHPGITARPYLRPAIDDKKDEFNKECAAAIKQVWK